MIHYHLEPQYLYVLRLQKLAITPGVIVYCTNHVTPRKVWIVNIEEKHRGYISKY